MIILLSKNNILRLVNVRRNAFMPDEESEEDEKEEHNNYHSTQQSSSKNEIKKENKEARDIDKQKLNLLLGSYSSMRTGEVRALIAEQKEKEKENKTNTKPTNTTNKQTHPKEHISSSSSSSSPSKDASFNPRTWRDQFCPTSRIEALVWDESRRRKNDGKNTHDEGFRFTSILTPAKKKKSAHTEDSSEEETEEQSEEENPEPKSMRVFFDPAPKQIKRARGMDEEAIAASEGTLTSSLPHSVKSSSRSQQPFTPTQFKEFNLSQSNYKHRDAVPVQRPHKPETFPPEWVNVYK